MPVTWDDYLAAPDAERRFTSCYRRCRGSFARQRQNIGRIVDALAPKTVACLGAGVLNDIPYEKLVHRAGELHLVDWLAGSVETGVRLATIDCTGEHPCCVYCAQLPRSPSEYCSNYAPASSAEARVCDRFALADGDSPTCAAFVLGLCPSIHYADVTAGYASEFGRSVTQELRRARNWQQAFSMALKLAKRIRPRRPLPIPSRSIDLVTSSMLVTQFDHEPYDFFSRRAVERLRAPSAADEQQLLPMMERLRGALMIGQLRGHFNEVVRMLAAGGAFYLSFELLHTVPESQRKFLVAGVAGILDEIGARFEFDVRVIPHDEMLSPFSTFDDESLVASLLLRVK